MSWRQLHRAAASAEVNNDPESVFKEQPVEMKKSILQILEYMVVLPRDFLSIGQGPTVMQVGVNELAN